MGEKTPYTELWHNSPIVSTESAGKAEGKQALVKDYLPRAHLHSTEITSSSFSLQILPKNEKHYRLTALLTSPRENRHSHRVILFLKNENLNKQKIVTYIITFS